MNIPGKATFQAAARVLLVWAKAVFTPLSLFAIAFFIWQERASLGLALSEGSWTTLLPALLLWIFANLLSPLVTVHVCRMCGMDISYLRTLSIHCSRLPAKYLPGGIWHSVGRANDYMELGHSPAKVGLYFIVENVLLVTLTLGMSSAVVQGLIPDSSLRRLVQILPFVMGLILLSLPMIMHKAGRRTPLKAYVSAVVLAFAYWCLVGITFACYISAFQTVAVSTSFIEVGAVYIFSWSVGYLALFAPQGIGVAEFVSGSLLADGAALGEIFAFLIGFRLLVLAADLGLWLAARLLKSAR